MRMVVESREGGSGVESREGGGWGGGGIEGVLG